VSDEVGGGFDQWVVMGRCCSCPGSDVAHEGRRFVGGGRLCVTHVSIGFVCFMWECIGRQGVIKFFSFQI